MSTFRRWNPLHWAGRRDARKRSTKYGRRQRIWKRLRRAPSPCNSTQDIYWITHEVCIATSDLFIASCLGKCWKPLWRLKISLVLYLGCLSLSSEKDNEWGGLGGISEPLSSARYPSVLTPFLGVSASLCYFCCQILPTFSAPAPFLPPPTPPPLALKQYPPLSPRKPLAFWNYIFLILFQNVANRSKHTSN